MSDWDPRIVVFACNWCSYAGADTAGVSRIPYAPNVRVIRVMCSGRIHPAFVLRAFEKGADGVLVSGCHPGDCHYIEGNAHAAEQITKVRLVVALLGLEPERLRLEWISGAEGPRFAAVVNEFTAQVRALGPTGLGRASPLPLPPPPMPGEGVQNTPVSRLAGDDAAPAFRAPSRAPRLLGGLRNRPSAPPPPPALGEGAGGEGHLGATPSQLQGQATP